MQNSCKRKPKEFLAKKILTDYFPAFAKNVFNYRLQDFHKKIYEFIDTRKKSLINAPRGFGKSTFFNTLYTIWRIVRNKNIRIAIVSNTDTQARAFLRPISRYLKNNETLKSIFGEFYSKTNIWSENEIFINGRTIIEKEATISAYGVQSDKIVGKHFDLIICDDIVDLENSRTSLQREKLKEWFYQVLLPTLMEEGEILIIGTRYNPLDLYYYLIKNEYRENHIVFRAILTNERGDEVSLWEERFPIEKLKKIRSEMGIILFAAQYQNDASLMAEGNLVKPDNVQYYQDRNQNEADYFYPIGQEYGYVQSIDLGVGDGDYSVSVMLGYNTRTKLIYVVDIIAVREKVSLFKQRIKRQWEKFRHLYPVVYCEANGFQTTIVQDLNDLFKDMRIIPVKNTVNKYARFIGVLSPVFDEKRIYINKNNAYNQLIETQLFALTPTGSTEHDDIPDAITMAIEHLPKISSGTAIKFA